MKTRKVILQELIEEADSQYIYDAILNGSLKRQSGEYKASQVGKLVEGLSPELRATLKDLNAEDVENFFFTEFRRVRPEKPITRRRGPVSFTKSKD